MRPAEEVTLGVGAPFGSQSLELLLRLDTFSGRDNAETATKADNGANNRQAFLVLCQIPDEGLIDLDSVERKAAQIADDEYPVPNFG